MPIRWRSTALLSAGFAVLVLLLALLQWRWLYEIEGHEQYRLERQVSYTTWQFKMAFDRELESLAGWMTAPTSSGTELGPHLAARLRGWRASTRWPALVREVYVLPRRVAQGEPSPLRLDPTDGTLRPEPWPTALQPVEAMLASLEPTLAERQDRRILSAVPAVVVPSTGPGGGFVVLRLDEDYLASTLLPELVDLMFPEPTFETVEVAVIEAVTGRVVYSTADITRVGELGRADSLYGLAERFEQDSTPGWGLPPSPELWPEAPASSTSPHSSPPLSDDELWRADLWGSLFFSGHWHVVSRGGELSIPDQVARARARKTFVGFGLLALLVTGNVALIVVTRRTQREADERLEQLARVSHELRTPLAVVSAAGDNLSDTVVTGPDQVRAYGRAIQKETRRLHELVENTLHLARRSAGVPGPELEPVDLTEVVDDALELARPGLDQAGFSVDRSIPERPVELFGDARSLRSAVSNLISNALRHGRSGGWLGVAVETDPGRGEVRLRVADRGPGIGDDDLGALCRPYARGATTARGSGLGLAVVADVVAAHGGRLTVERPADRAEGGAVFVVHLPLPELADEPDDSREAS